MAFNANVSSRLSNMVVVLIGAALTIVGAVVMMILLNQLAPTYFDNFGGLLANITGISTGNELADAMIAITGIIAAVLGSVFFLIILIGAFVAGGSQRS